MTIQEFFKIHKVKDVSNKLNVSTNLLYNYKFDKQKVSYRVWKKIKDEFGVEIRVEISKN